MNNHIRTAIVVLLTALLTGSLLCGCSASAPVSTPLATPDMSATAMPSLSETMPNAAAAEINPYTDLEVFASMTPVKMDDWQQMVDFIGLLPAITDKRAGQFVQNRFTLQLDEGPRRIILFYEPNGMEKGLNIDTNFSMNKAENNAAILMAFLDVEKVTLRFRDRPSYDTIEQPNSTEWAHYTEEVSFTWDKLSNDGFGGQDFKALAKNLPAFSQLLAENAQDIEIGSVQFMLGPECYVLDSNSISVILPKLWMDNVVMQTGDHEEGPEGSEIGYSLYVKPRHSNSIFGGYIARLYTFSSNIWEKNYQSDTQYGLINIGENGGSVFALRLFDIRDDFENYPDAKPLLEGLYEAANAPDFASQCTVSRIMIP